MALDKTLLSLVICPRCKEPLKEKNNELLCAKCKVRYPIKDGIPVLLSDEEAPLNTQE